MASDHETYVLRSTPSSSSEMLHDYPVRIVSRYPPNNTAKKLPDKTGNETAPATTELTRCPSCCKNINPIEDALIPRGRDPTISLHKTLGELETTLRRHGSDLHKLEILASTTVPGRLQKGLPTPPALDGYMTPESSQTRGFPRTRDSLGLGILRGREAAIDVLNGVLPNGLSEESEGSDDGIDDAEMLAERKSMALSHFSALQSVHPLLYDLEDLKAFTAGVTRLLRTLHRKVNQVENDARALRVERQELVKQNKATRELQQDLEIEKESIRTIKERARREARKARDLKMEAERLERQIREQAEKDAIKAITPERLTRTMGTQTKIRTPIDLPERVASPPVKSDVESLQLKRTVSFGVPESPRRSISEPPPLPESTWTPEKEELLRSLEARLRQANMKWSDEQEDVLAEIEPLKEEHRKAKKIARRATEPSSKDGPHEIPPLGKKDSKVSLKMRRGSDGDEPPPKPAGGILKLFGKKARRRSESE